MGRIAGAVAQARGARAQADAIREGNEAQIAFAREALDLTRPQIEAGDTARAGLLQGLGYGTPEQMEQHYQNFQDSGFYRAAREGFDIDREYIDGGMSRGSLFSGARLRALDDRARQRASQAYGQYYNANAGLSGAGQVATGQSGQILSNAGTNTLNAFNQIGQTQANRAQGIGNAVGGGLQAIGNVVFGGF